MSTTSGTPNRLPVEVELLASAGPLAKSGRERQVVAIAAAFVAGDHDLGDALAREHLADHPDSVLVAWIASTNHTNRTRRDNT
jgi:hypothetical protein